MIEDIGGVTSQLVKTALDVSVLRQHVIANNIANAKTPGYSPKSVSFEELINKGLVTNGGASSSEDLRTQLHSLKTQLDNGSLTKTNDRLDVEMDMEMANLASNTIRYQALLEGLSKRGSIIKMAISEGR